jgi:hypothetical protein
MNESGHQIGAERQSDDEAEDCFKHEGTSQPFEKPRIDGKKAEGAGAHGQEDQVKHNHLQGLIRPGTCARCASNLDWEGVLGV